MLPLSRLFRVIVNSEPASLISMFHLLSQVSDDAFTIRKSSNSRIVCSKYLLVSTTM